MLRKLVTSSPAIQAVVVFKQTIMSYQNKFINIENALENRLPNNLLFRFKYSFSSQLERIRKIFYDVALKPSDRKDRIVTVNVTTNELLWPRAIMLKKSALRFAYGDDQTFEADHSLFADPLTYYSIFKNFSTRIVNAFENLTEVSNSQPKFCFYLNSIVKLVDKRFRD